MVGRCAMLFLMSKVLNMSASKLVFHFSPLK